MMALAGNLSSLSLLVKATCRALPCQGLNKPSSSWLQTAEGGIVGLVEVGRNGCKFLKIPIAL